MSRQVSVVVPCLNEADNLPSLLNLLFACSVVKEVIVVDGGSTDATMSVASRMGSLAVSMAGPGLGWGVAAQRNYGASLATAEIILFIDADTIIQPQVLEKMVDEFERRHLDIACPWFVPTGRSLVVHGLIFFCSLIFWTTQKFRPSGAGGCVMVKRAAFWRAGGFCPQQLFEDIEMIRRVGRTGRYGVIRVPVITSSRRFEAEGVWRVTGKYLLMILFFSLGWFSLSKHIRYGFQYRSKNHSG